MAELLICAKDSNGSGGGQYKKGDIVTVQDAGFQWGTKETLPKFFVLGLDVTKEKVLAYTEPDQGPEEMVDYDDELQVGIYARPPMVKRRIWGFQMDNVPQGVRDIILTTGRYDTTVAVIKPYVRHKNTDEEADFNG